MLAVALGSAVLGNTISVSTTDIRSGAAFDNIEATWGKSVDIGDSKAQLSASYDRNENKDFLKSISLAGDASDDGDLKISYEVEHNFGSGDTDVSVSAVSGGTTFSAEYAGGEVTEVGAATELDVGDSKVDTEVSWMVKDEKARIKMMTAVGDASVSAQFDYKDGDTTSLEIGYETELESGRDMSVTYSADDKDLEIEITDTNFEDDATWTATANLPTSDSGNMMDSATLTLKRSWTW